MLQALEGFSFRDVVHGDAGMAISEIGLWHGAKPLLAGCVPDLQLDVPVVDIQGFGFEIDADCYSVIRIEYFVWKPQQKRRFASSTVSNHDHLVYGMDFLLPHVFCFCIYPWPYFLFTLFSGDDNFWVDFTQIENFIVRIKNANFLFVLELLQRFLLLFLGFDFDEWLGHFWDNKTRVLWLRRLICIARTLCFMRPVRFIVAMLWVVRVCPYAVVFAIRFRMDFHECWIAVSSCEIPEGYVLLVGNRSRWDLRELKLRSTWLIVVLKVLWVRLHVQMYVFLN